MLNKIIHFSLHNRLLVLVAAVLLMMGGTYSALHTDVDVFPDLTAPTVVVMTEAGGMAAEEVEQLVTFPIETAVNGATHVRRVRSSSTNGFSILCILLCNAKSTNLCIHTTCNCKSCRIICCTINLITRRKTLHAAVQQGIGSSQCTVCLNC